MSTETPTAAYVAWWRASRRDPWQQAASGDTEAAAFKGLLDALTDRRGGESIVLPNGRRPDQTANRRYR